MKIWWVLPQNYGEGPFRWLVYTQDGGTLVAISNDFDLPTNSRQRVMVAMTLPEK